MGRYRGAGECLVLSCLVPLWAARLVSGSDLSASGCSAGRLFRFGLLGWSADLISALLGCCGVAMSANGVSSLGNVSYVAGGVHGVSLENIRTRHVMGNRVSHCLEAVFCRVAGLGV